MELDFQKLLHSPGAVVQESGEVSLQSRDFPGYSITEPVKVACRATAHQDTLTLEFTAEARVVGECARCLAPVEQDETIEKVYELHADELRGDDPELPLNRGGSIDVDELVYGELIIEVPGVLLCGEDCEGLCQRCGKPKAQCGCPAEPLGDERLQVLRQLLDSENP